MPTCIHYRTFQRKVTEEVSAAESIDDRRILEVKVVVMINPLPTFGV